MKKTLLTMLIVVVCAITLCICCKTIQPQFDYKTTLIPPQVLVDSIANSHGIIVPDYHTWERDYFFTSDSVVVPTYYYFARHNKRNYIFTIVASPDSTIHLVKFRYE